MDIQDKIKKWVSLDNNQKKLASQIKILRDEKSELTNDIISFFDSKNLACPIINISDGKLNVIEVKQPNVLSYKFLAECFKNFFRNNESNNSSSNIDDLLLEFIKSQRTYNNIKNIKRVYNNYDNK